MWSNALCLLVLAFIASVVAQNVVREAPNDAMAQIIGVLANKISIITEEVHRHNQRRQEASASDAGSAASDAPNAMSQLIAALGSKASITKSVAVQTTMPPCVGNFAAPDPTLAREMLTALPGSVLGQLGNEKARSSIASEFKAGHTPSWYDDLSPNVKKYVQSVQTRATTGCTPYPTEVDTSNGGAGGANAKVGGDKAEGTSTSSALASRPTAALVGVSGVLGMLGLMVAL